MKILFCRGAFLNLYEGQNLEPLAKKYDLTGVASKTAIHTKFKFPVKTFWSPYDVINKTPSASGKIVKAICNRTIGDPHYLFGFEDWVKKTGPYDIAHIAETYYYYDLQAVNLKKQGYIKKIISTCWETIPFNNESVKQKKRQKESVRDEIDFFIYPTERAKNALLNEGVSPNKITNIRIGVDTNTFKPKKMTSKKNDKIAILFVGRLVKEKGINDLLYTFKQIYSQNKKVSLAIVGVGPLKQDLQNQINKNGLHHCCTIVHRWYEYMPKLYKRADILVMPSKTTKTWEEQYGMVLVEAMACGLPIVASNSGAIPEVIGNAGILVNEGDKTELYQGIMALIEDELLRYKYSLMARKRAEDEFGREKCARNISNLYYRLL